MSETMTAQQATDSTPPAEPIPAAPQDKSGETLAKRRDGQPSQRDRVIYERHVLRGDTQDAIAADHHCSRQRVSQICRKVERWLATHPDDELAAALRVRCQRRFDALYVDAFQQFQRSKQDLVVERERTSHRVPDGQPEKGVKTTVHERLRRQQNGDARFLNAALRAVERMERLVSERKMPEADQGRNAGQVRNAECGVWNGEAKGRPGETEPAKPWWLQQQRRSTLPPPAPSVSAPAAPRDGGTGQVGDDATGPAGDEAAGPVGDDAAGQAGDDATERQRDAAAGRENEGATARDGEGAKVPGDKPPEAADIPHSALRTPHSCSLRTPRSSPPRAPHFCSTGHAPAPAPLRDTLLIVGAPGQVTQIETYAREKLPRYQFVACTSLVAVADWLERDLASAALISLDDDLGGRRVVLGEMAEPGTMDQVAREIIKYPACCPVVLNTAQEQAKRLMEILLPARWDTHWAKPTGGHWLKHDWLGAVKRQLRHNQRRVKDNFFSRR